MLAPLIGAVSTTATAQAMPAEQPDVAGSGTAPAAGAAQAEDGPTGVMMDSDFGHTWDDATALAVANATDDRGEAKLLGVMMNIPNSDAAGAIAAINSYYGNGQVPIGRLSDYQQVYSTFLAKNYPHPDRFDKALLPDAARRLYREILSRQPDRSVTIVPVGLLDNLAALLESAPDKYSELTGAQLVERKVRHSSSWVGRIREYNFYAHPTQTAAVVENWPTPMVFDGHEVGTQMNAGRDICQRTPRRNPVAGLHGYLFGLRQRAAAGTARRQLRRDRDVLRHLRHRLHLRLRRSGGSNHVTADGSNAWRMDEGTPDQAHLVPLVSKEEIANKVNSVLYYVPSRGR